VGVAPLTHPPLSDFIWKHTERLKHLELQMNQMMTILEMRTQKPAINLFRDTTSGPLPLLETLTVGKFSEDIRHIFQLLRLAPIILECHFDSVGHPLAFAGKGDMVVIPTLRQLTCTEINGGDRENILDNFTPPSLDIRTSYHTLDRFLKRSARCSRDRVAEPVDVGLMCSRPDSHRVPHHTQALWQDVGATVYYTGLPHRLERYRRTSFNRTPWAPCGQKTRAAGQHLHLTEILEFCQCMHADAFDDLSTCEYCSASLDAQEGPCSFSPLPPHTDFQFSQLAKHAPGRIVVSGYHVSFASNAYD
jgi:hypothetical protein